MSGCSGCWNQEKRGLPKRKSRLKRHEALAMLDYPLRLIASDYAVMRYLTRPEYGSEGLTEFVKKLSYP